MKKWILFLIRKRLGLKFKEPFRFNNQKSKTDYYFFDDEGLKKVVNYNHVSLSDVSLNWLLNDECEITYLDYYMPED